jgi:hypothetical protein
MLIISEKVLEERAYHRTETEITWENSDIRAFLNGEFLERFSADDRARIMHTNVVNSNNPEHETDGGNDTTDRVFLLSIEEVESHFTDDNSRNALDNNGNAWWWWLRSPGSSSSDAARVLTGGGVTAGGGNVNNSIGGVRPAMWLNLVVVSTAMATASASTAAFAP